MDEGQKYKEMALFRARCELEYLVRGGMPACEVVAMVKSVYRAFDKEWDGGDNGHGPEGRVNDTTSALP